MNISERKKTFTDVMLERWAVANRFLPNVDKVLIESEEPLVNGGKTLQMEERVAYAAEFN